MYRFIAIEGPDGAGKTTTTIALARSLGYVAIKTPSEEFRKRRADFDAPGVDTLSRFNFYAEGVKASSNEIMKILSLERGVVVDRYLSSLIVYHSAMDHTTDYARLVCEMDLPPEDLQIVLFADNGTLRSRINQRIGTQSRTDKHIEMNGRLLADITTKFLTIGSERGVPTVVVDTGSNQLDRVVQQCLFHIH